MPMIKGAKAVSALCAVLCLAFVQAIYVDQHHIYDVAYTHNPSTARALMQYCEHLTPKNENTLLSTLWPLLKTSQHKLEFMRGGHFIVDDQGSLYMTLRAHPRSRLRHSSHQSTQPQYGIEDPFLKECLIGTYQHEGKIYSWFQLECHSTQTLNLFPHLMTFFESRIRRYNIGPYGYSRHIDRAPIELAP